MEAKHLLDQLKTDLEGLVLELLTPAERRVYEYYHNLGQLGVSGRGVVIIIG